jgi:hypothetical protein
MRADLLVWKAFGAVLHHLQRTRMRSRGDAALSRVSYRMNFNFLSWLVVDQLQHLGLRKAEGLDSIDEASNAFGRRLLTLRRVDVLHNLRSRAQQTLRLRSIEWAKMRLILDVLRSRIDPLASGSPNAAPILFQDTPDLHVRKQRRGVVDAATHCVNTAPARMRAAFATYTIINRLVKSAVTGLFQDGTQREG